MDAKTYHVQLPIVTTHDDGRIEIHMRMADYQHLVGSLGVDAVAPASACDGDRLAALAGVLVGVLPQAGQDAVRSRCRAVKRARKPA